MIFFATIFICYFTVALIRKTSIKNEWLPLISGGLGMLISTIAYFVIPSVVPTDTLGITSIYGFFCGLAATGSNQVFKQAIKLIKNKYNIKVTLPENEEKGDK